MAKREIDVVRIQEAFDRAKKEHAELFERLQHLEQLRRLQEILDDSSPLAFITRQTNSTQGLKLERKRQYHSTAPSHWFEGGVVY
jgi:ribosomal 50S subunit-associated protein YjgA (DUF615 family)